MSEEREHVTNGKVTKMIVLEMTTLRYDVLFWCFGFD